MPAFYAHKRFGAVVLKKLPTEFQEIIQKHRSAYEVGLQGPDIFFYYRPFYINRIIKTGTGLHHAPAREYFENALRVLHKFPKDSAQYAYLLGFITHFTLDSECHPFVNAYIEKSGVEHLEIEEEFEKLLLILDHKDPIAYPYKDQIPADFRTAHAVSCFYPTISTPQTLRALKDMKIVKRLFTSPQAYKHFLVNGCFFITRQAKVYKGLMNQKKYNKACEESNKTLLKMLYASVPVAVGLMKDFDLSLTKHTALPARFDRNFE